MEFNRQDKVIVGTLSRDEAVAFVKFLKKVIVGTLSRDEAVAFVKFLESEIIRHEDDILQAKSLIGYVKHEKLQEQ